MSDNIVFLLKKDAKLAGLTSPVTRCVPVHRAEIDLRPVLADLLRSKIPAAIVLESRDKCAVWRQPVEKRVHEREYYADGGGPPPVIGKRRNSQVNFNHA